jgi:hypothetical protein
MNILPLHAPRRGEMTHRRSKPVAHRNVFDRRAVPKHEETRIKPRANQNYFALLGEEGRSAGLLEEENFVSAGNSYDYPGEHQQYLENAISKFEVGRAGMTRKICKPGDRLTYGAFQVVGRSADVVRQQSYAVETDKTDQRKAEQPFAPSRAEQWKPGTHPIKILQSLEIN